VIRRTSRYGGLRYSRVQDRAVGARLFDLAANSASSAPGAAALRLPLSARRRGAAVMAEGKILPISTSFQHAAPLVVESDETPANEEKTLERIRNWRRLVPISRYARPSSSVFPRRREDFAIFLDWLARRGSTGRAFKIRTVAGLRPMIGARAFPTK